MMNESLKLLQQDMLQSENELLASKLAFERELKNGLGESIIKELNNPSKPDKKLEKKLKRHYKFQKIKENFKKITKKGEN